MTQSRGFKTWGRDMRQYGLATKKPKEGVRRELGAANSVDIPVSPCTSSFAEMAVKFIGPSYRWVCAAVSVELAATWGQSGKYREVKQ